MTQENQNSNSTLLAFLLGGIAGSAITFLFAPKSGRELRGDIIDKIEYYQIQAAKKQQGIITDARAKSSELFDKAELLFEKVRQFAFGKYDTPIEKIEMEILSLKAALKAAANSYKNKNGNGKSNYAQNDNDLKENIDFNVYDDEILPKHLSMRRRNN